jgi:hypothetical protein
MIKMKLIGAVAIIALIADLSSAQAGVVYVTYTGTVTSSSDLTGMFGPVGFNNLVGDSYQVSYQFNPALGYTYSSPTENFADGGSFYPAPSPALSATVTINGVSVSSNLTGYQDQILGLNNGTTYAGQSHMTSYFDPNAGNIYISNGVNNYIFSDSDFTMPASIITPFNYIAQGSDYTRGHVYFTTIDNSTGAYLVATYASATITSLTVSVVGEFPPIPNNPFPVPAPTPGVGLLSLAFFILAGVWIKARGFLAR